MAKVIRYFAFGLIAVLLLCVFFYTKTEKLHRSVTYQSDRREVERVQAEAQKDISTCPDRPTRAPCKCPAAGGNIADTEAVVDRPPKTHEAAPPRGPKVLILTSMRTGSSFIGEIFGQNTDVFYLFEPGLALLTELANRGAIFIQPMYIDMLKALFRCNTTSLDYYITWLKRQPPHEVIKKVPRVSEVICNKTGERARCGTPTHDLFMKTCRANRNLVFKSIRVKDIGMLDALIEDSGVNLKIIHLVRDPRGMTASRVLAMNFVEHTDNKLEAKSFTYEMQTYLLEYCSYSVDNKIAGYYLPKYRDNYYPLRYEDMSLDPHGTTQRLYNFAGLGAVPETISKWVAHNTQEFRPGVYSTTRVSSKAYQDWRTKLNFETAKAIENMGRCKEMMDHFGYLPVQNDYHLKNLSSSLVDTLPAPRTPERYELL